MPALLRAILRHSMGRSGAWPLPGRTRRNVSPSGIPHGLQFVGATEVWDHISFHGIQALLALYVVEQLFLPIHAEHIVGFVGLRSAVEWATGPLSTQVLAAVV